MAAGALFLGFAALGAGAEIDTNLGIQLALRVQQADAKRTTDVAEVTSVRRYVLKNHRWTSPAAMTVRMISVPGAAKRFEILSMENVNALQKRVFGKILESEVDLSQQARAGSADISLANYGFVYAGSETLDGRPCAIIQLLPKRKNKYLIQGKAWVDTEAAAIVRIEGEAAADISFWIRRPSISLNFRRVEGIWVPSSHRSSSDVRMWGETELTVEYLSYMIEAKAGVRSSP